ncbi:glutathione S-transferase family protein [Sulfitobacter sp. M57]|uniref:glutathione S-transferase family protein n=1 Tax=unclassified Sulfitobacter TaxID=196795 RepID=UPI0023E1B085|nr:MULTISPECIES: glutathione S-transferase family protein [unclassified Sulfitobacter]MDF3415409.1 glutathione S-transferase family protein [Sulfitobacter sp. KE5]MDF3422890.1 glutathione S-transferase family protein [Sulfitobacter sp. KE43]MDF3433955.1 glutathione S-transferase family protein [Sulfitobacter sp. KE42]MDF3459595.1 glutathione S-transferase family protein [Sulfitobacter sp. S74]MDF3463494.1 glutathione S-transferase family protein [Sulfitobacter sp. Ks18]
MKLYFAPGTISVAVAIALEEAGLNYDPIKVDFATAGQTHPDYLALNPKGRVPALITDKGGVLTETGALLDYIAALAPEAGLVPQDPEDTAHMRSVMYYLASTMHVAHAHKLRGSRWADQQSSHEDMTAKVAQTMSDCAAYVQSDCLRGDFVGGDHLSLADPYLFIVCSWLAGDGVPLAEFPQIGAYLARMEARDSVKTIRKKGML